MKKLNWFRTDNFFLSITDGNYTKAKVIFDAHDLKMKNGIAEKIILDLYNFSHPFFENYDNLYALWSGLRSSSAGNTKLVVQIIDDLSGTKIRVWDIAIQSVYDIKSSEYKKLLPKRRIPFQNGKIESRKTALSNLIAAIGNDAKLKTVLADVESTLEALTNALNTQGTQQTSIDAAIVKLETARIEASEVMFRNYSLLMGEYFKAPKTADIYFPIEFLSTRSQISFTHTLVEGAAPFKLFKRTLNVQKQTLVVVYYGTEKATMYFTNGISKVPIAGDPFVVLQPQSRTEYNLPDLNYSDANKHLYVHYEGSGTALVEVDVV
jgi:hypothetical protein